MKYDPFPLRAPARLLFCLALAVSATITSAQQADATKDSPATKADETIILPPFEVRTDKDQGYLAQNAASGSRLNTQLVDTPAPISVYTKAFLSDIGATNIAELSEYAVNISHEVGFQNGLASGNALGEFDTQFRIRGLATSNNTGRSVDFFKYPIEVDIYNTERIEYARGPNSILFGLGTPAGNFDVSTKKADVGRSLYEVTVRGGDDDALRTSVDFNQPIIAGKVALRANVLNESQNSWRPNEYKDAKRMALALRYQITPRASLDVQFERGLVSQANQRPWVGVDYMTDWINKGRQIDPVRGLPTPANASLATLPPFQAYTVFDTSTGTIYDWRGMSTSAATSHSGSQNPNVPPSDQVLLRNFSVVPRTVVLEGLARGTDTDYHDYSMFFRDELAQDFFVELAYLKMEDLIRDRDILPQDIHITYDTNAQLPDGTINPNAGKPYVESVWRNIDRHEYSDDLRATTSYLLNLGRIFGKHQLAALAELRHEHTIRDALFETILNNPPDPTNPDSAANYLHRRTYVDLSGPVDKIAMVDYRSQPVSGVVNKTTGKTVTTGFVPNQSGVYDYHFKFTSYMAASQSSFWDDRIVATLGYRKDYSDSYYSTAARGTPTAPFTAGFWQAVPSTTPVKLEGGTSSEGVVFHAMSWVSVFYNHSSNLSLPNPQIILFPGTPAPVTDGKSNDVGLKFSLFGGKVFLSGSYYKTAAKNDNDFLGTGTPSPINDIWRTLAGAGIITATQRDQSLVNDNGNTFDSNSEGYEVELIANPLRELRLSLSYSNNRSVRTNIGRAAQNYVTQNRDFWTQNGRDRLIINGNGAMAAKAIDATDGVTTVAEDLANIDTSVQNNIVIPDGQRYLGNPAETANLRANYTFSNHLLRGFSIGSGVRWRGQPVIGYTSTNPATRQLIWGQSYYLIDANIGYRRKVRLAGHMYDWSIQLNVNNLLDEEKPITTQAFTDGSSQLFRFQTPRQWYLSTTFTF